MASSGLNLSTPTKFGNLRPPFLYLMEEREWNGGDHYLLRMPASLMLGAEEIGMPPNGVIVGHIATNTQYLYAPARITTRFSGDSKILSRSSSGMRVVVAASIRADAGGY